MIAGIRDTRENITVVLIGVVITMNREKGSMERMANFGNYISLI